MSSRNKHDKSTWQIDSNFKKCRKRNCTGTMIHCQVTYKPGGPVHNELECSNCSNITKDPKFSNRFRNLYKQSTSKFNRPRYNEPSGPARTHNDRNR